MSIKDQWRRIRDAEEPGKEFQYNRDDLVTRFAIVIQMGRPDTADEDALRIAKTLAATTMSEYRWMDVCKGENYNARD